jgi:hypothetical protein
VILPTSINLTAISFEIFRIVSLDTAELQLLSLLSFLFAAIICFLINVDILVKTKKFRWLNKTPLLNEEGQFVKVTAEASVIKNNLLSHSNDCLIIKVIVYILPEFVEVLPQR